LWRVLQALPIVGGDATVPEQERKMDQLDETAILTRVGDDLDLLGDVVELFHQNSRELLDSIEAAAASGDTAALQRLAHTLKGSAGNFTTTGLYDLARDLEMRAGSGDLAGARALSEPLRQQAERLATALTELLERRRGAPAV